MDRKTIAYNATRDAILHSCAGIVEVRSKKSIINQITNRTDCRMLLANPKEITRFVPKDAIPHHKLKDFVTLFSDAMMKISAMFAIHDCFNYSGDEYDAFKNRNIRDIRTKLSTREKSIQIQMIELLMFGSRDFILDKQNAKQKLLKLFKEDSWNRIILLNKDHKYHSRSRRDTRDSRDNRNRNRNSREFVSYDTFLSNMMNLGYIHELGRDHNKITLHGKYIDIINNFSKIKQDYVRCVLRSIVSDKVLRHKAPDSSSRRSKFEVNNNYDKYRLKYDKYQSDRMECRAQRWVIKYLFQNRHINSGDYGENIIRQLLPNFTSDDNIIEAINLTNEEFLERMVNCGYIDCRYDSLNNDRLYKVSQSVLQELNLSGQHSLTYIERRNICLPYWNSNKNNKKKVYFVI